MRFDLTSPCGDCPFRSDKPFHLSPERVRQILGGGDHWWPAASFPCHRTIIYGDDENGDTTTIPPSAQQCAGVMAILHRENRPNDAMQVVERWGLWNPAALDPTAPFYASTEDAIRGQEAMVRFGDIGSIRRCDYVCPHCGHVEHTRRLHRLHITHAHRDMDKLRLTSGDRATLSGRAKRMKVTLPKTGKEKDRP